MLRFRGIGRSGTGRFYPLPEVRGRIPMLEMPEALYHGGQRQKMGIARALLSKAEYMIFDEATSGVDPQSEKEIWGNHRTSG